VLQSIHVQRVAVKMSRAMWNWRSYCDVIVGLFGVAVEICVAVCYSVFMCSMLHLKGWNWRSSLHLILRLLGVAVNECVAVCYSEWMCSVLQFKWVEQCENVIVRLWLCKCVAVNLCCSVLRWICVQRVAVKMSRAMWNWRSYYSCDYEVVDCCSQDVCCSVL